MTKDDCIGCRDDFYNGKNNLGVKECCHFKGAKLILQKEVHINQRPPWNQKAIQVPKCFHRAHYVYVDADRTC